MANEELDALKEEAKELGIEFSTSIGAAKLQEKIDAYYASQETSGKELEAAMTAAEQAGARDVARSNSKNKMAKLARDLYEDAKKTKIVTVIDNDQRVNGQTTTCSANWSNGYYDLGTRSIPLNIPVELQQGFIDVLKEVRIPHHTKDTRTGLSQTVMRSRYSITEETDLKPSAE